MKTFFCLLLSALGLNAATVQFNMTNSVGQADTNYFRLIPIQDPILAHGGVIVRGPAVRCYPNSIGFFSTNLTLGWWQMTNSFLNQGALFEVPDDNFTYNITNLLVSGFNTYVMSGIVGLTSSNGSVTFYPPAGRGIVDVSAAGSIPIMAGSNIVIFQAGGSNVINSTAAGTGVTNNQKLPGLSGATNFSSTLIYVADEVLTNGISDTSGTYRIQIDANDTAIRGPFGGLFYVTSTNAVLGALQRYIGNGAGLTNLSITNYLIPNAGSTNLGVQSLNSSNIYIGADSPAGGPNATFTNSSYSIAIGSRFPVAAISGNNAIYIGGSAGGAGPNSLSIGIGAGSGGINEDGSTSQAGSIAIGNQVDCFGRNSMVISAGTSSGMNLGGLNSVFIGNVDSDQTVLTNVFFWGHRAASINLSNNTFYFGNGPGGGVSMDRVQRFVFLGGAGNGHIMGNGDELTNVSAFRLVATNGNAFSYTNDPTFGNMWATTNDDGLWAGYFRAKALQISDPTTGIIDKNIAPVITGDNAAHNYFWGYGGSGPLDGDTQGNFTLQGSGSFKVKNNLFANTVTVTNSQTNLFLTANQLVGSGVGRQLEDVFIGAGLTLSGSPKVLSGTGGAGGWGNIADRGTNEMALGYFAFINPTNSNNGTNWTFFTGTNWCWQNVGTNGGGDYKTNTFFWGNGSTSNMFKTLNPSLQQVFIWTTNGYFNFGTNNQVIIDASGNITLSGQINGSLGGATQGSLPLSALPQIAAFSVIGNPNSGISTPSVIGTASLLDPIGNLFGGLAIRGAGFWTNSGASALTALMSSATITNVGQANTLNFTNSLNGYGVAPGSYINLGIANGTSNSWNTVTGSNDVYWIVGNSTILLWTNPMGGANLGWTIPSGVNLTNKNFSTGVVHSDSNGKLTSSAVVAADAPSFVVTNDSRALTLSGTNYWAGNNVFNGSQTIASNGFQITGTLNVTNGIIQTTNTSAASQGITLDPSKTFSTFSGSEVAIGTTGITNAGYISNAGAAGFASEVVTNGTGYITNAPATGNATITWDMSKNYSMVSTSVAVTVNITGLVAGEVFHSTLVLSNQSGTARAVTGGGFSMMTNNLNTPASAINMTNNDSKHQRLVLKADGVAGVITNVWAYQVYDP